MRSQIRQASLQMLGKGQVIAHHLTVQPTFHTRRMKSSNRNTARASRFWRNGPSRNSKKKTSRLHASSAITRSSDRSTYDNARLTLTKRKPRSSDSKTKSGK
ncbi:hypothetical protein BDP55DRAFT_678418 [Colletotrichum godetiae]|uniref:Uncharacterized protein n=1 Tax=Colletotrichum godetiae TaxID=1209918 RepID=A0AAJ0AAX6_9PEZI|nr:uncharacterized protein BDP55DRAFT_688324 [Colletotrichum godetiae]XP_060424545.1 uncharacterized protein BDP55DRAFT_678418 [Colletotrichum godetiae]KAK1656671.1 hypothetical protein BDP55DRAFT_688324 [Colletotrichum godetiae]KAK1659781.1 hypothetical protein BDP55DRAFT_678418 [Colletotrichum godetiae]